MGCWNKTCGISRLHIRAGVPVHVFVLEANTAESSRGNRCYQTALFSPLLLPFQAKYDDYGGGEEWHGVGLDLIVEGLREKLVELDVGENKYHDIAVKRDDFDVNKFFEAVHEQRLFTRDFHGTKRTVDFVMIRDDVLNHILENLELEEYVGEGKGTGGYNNCYIYYRYADVIADVPAFIQHAAEKFAPKSGAEEDDEDIRSVMRQLRLHDGLSDVFKWQERHNNRASMYIHRDSHRYSNIVDPQAAVIELIEAGKLQEAETLLTEVIKGSFIDSFYSLTRNIWAPGCHEGSQAQEHAGYRALTSAITAALDSESADYEE